MIINYYQWVPYVLVMIGLLFRVPHQLWKYLEEGKMGCILTGVRNGKKKWVLSSNYFIENNLDNDIFRNDESEREIVLNNIAKYIVKHNETQGHI